ncbi:ATP-binding protein [Deinococcus sp. QL22]|uniref:sensor histidine kinase n=1 Tax=Deinococcus sp. QL22 TaxID=2939437 RepID=UPI0020182EA1|nr:ATP-binding protein [Deinococcus sp. QL22]UQN10751.1 ATP-binding protein [Deinococcus sp. QL22]UQN10797.1 ATP-binding protein [Deinococcus sp. QL22]
MPYEPMSSLQPDPSLTARLEFLEAQVQALQDAAAQASTLFRDAPEPAFLVNNQGRIVEANLQAAALLGTTPAFLQGRALAPLMATTHQGALKALFRRVFDGGGRQMTELQLLGPDGIPIDLRVAATLSSRGGEALYHLSALDVTAFKAAHQTLLDLAQKHEREIQQQTLRLRHLEGEFQEVMLASERELGTRLTRAQNFLNLLERQEHPDDRQRSLGHVALAVQQTQGLLESLRGYMRTRSMRARLRPVDLEQVLKEVRKDLAPLLSERGIVLSQMPLPTVQGDSQVLQLILHEYLTNALKFTRTRSPVRLRILVQETAHEHWIGVEDNGVGFNMRQKDKAFELFGRLHSAEHYEGTGLGLTVVRRLGERFGARAWGEGRVDHGATFWIAWPKDPVLE